MNAADWRKYVLQPVENELAQFRQNTQSTPIPDSLKRLLQSEVAFIFQSYLRDFANNYLSWGKNPARDSLMDIVMKWQPMPDSVQLISGFYANMMLKNHAHYQVNKIARKIPGDTTSLQTRASNFIGMPFSHIDSLIRKYGEEYFLAWLYACRHLPSSLQEKMLVNKVMNAVDNGDFEAAFALSDTLWNRFPESRYKGWVDNVIAGVHNRLKKQSSPGIHYRPPGTIRNLEDLVAPYKGKVIYIDIWGSWCGPCKAEMPYVPALKKKFEDKDVVFFYLDMDKPERIQTWKNYVTYIELIGEHYQMTSEEIEPIWKVVHEAGGNKDSYPGYLLIDRQGKLVHADAKRPSDGEALYQQIEALLK
jgi:thiol-disulfide isomerase/thioredoxin